MVAFRLEPVAVGLLFLIGLYLAALELRKLRELRARLAELLARAVEKALPLPRLVERIARENRGRRRRALADLARRLERGDPLSDALRATKPALATEEGAAAIRAVEGGDGLAAVLRTVAAEEGRLLARGHRLLVALLYPALAFLFFFGLDMVVRLGRRGLPSFRLGSPGLAAVLLAVGLLVLLRLSPWRRPRHALRPRPRLPATARVLRSVAVLLETGTPLPDALRAAAPASGRWLRTVRLAAAARRLEAGDDAAAALAKSGLPGFAVRRLAAAPAAAFPLAARQVAEECDRRHAARGERFLAVVGPVALAAVAFLVFLDFRGLMAWIASVERQVMPW